MVVLLFCLVVFIIIIASFALYERQRLLNIIKDQSQEKVRFNEACCALGINIFSYSPQNLNLQYNQIDEQPKAIYHWGAQHKEINTKTKELRQYGKEYFDYNFVDGSISSGVLDKGWVYNFELAARDFDERHLAAYHQNLQKLAYDLGLDVYLLDKNKNILYSNVMESKEFPFSDEEVAQSYAKRKAIEFELFDIKDKNGSRLVFARQKICKNEDKNQNNKQYEILAAMPIAISIFDIDKKLIFANHSFAHLFGFKEDFLEQRPTHGQILEELRKKSILGAMPKWQLWRDELFGIYHDLKSIQYNWELSDGRSIFVQAMAQNNGNICWIYQNLTEKLELERKFRSLIQRQGDSLDNLREGVGMFGSDGCLVLSNHEFCKLWDIDEQFGVEGKHISEIVNIFKTKLNSQSVCEVEQFISDITAADSASNQRLGTLYLKEGKVLQYNICSIVGQQYMLSFMDITAQYQMQKIRSDLIVYCSYELLAPLTSIIGFAQIMQMSEKNNQQYINDILSEAQKLNCKIINMVEQIERSAKSDNYVAKSLDMAQLLDDISKDMEQNFALNSLQFCWSWKDNDPFEIYFDQKTMHDLIGDILLYCANHAMHNSTIKLEISEPYEGSKNLELTFKGQNLGRQKEQIISSIDTVMPIAANICQLYNGNIVICSDEISCSINL